MQTRMLFVVLLIVSVATAADLKEDVKLFQQFYQDASITRTSYIAGHVDFADYDHHNTLFFGGRGGFRLGNAFELNAAAGLMNFSWDGGDDRTGFADMVVSGRYSFYHKSSRIVGGAYLSLPFGDADVPGQNSTDFGLFTAFRTPLTARTVLTGTLGLDTWERGQWVGDHWGDDRDYSLLLAGGLIHQLNSRLHVVSELTVKPEHDYLQLTGGADYRLGSGHHLRGALGFGLDNGAPDVQILFDYLFSL